MAVRERRRTPGEAALILALLLACACGEPAGRERPVHAQETGELQVTSGPVASEKDGDRPGGAPLADAGAHERGSWTRRLEAIVERHKAEVARASKGSALAADVRVSLHVQRLGAVGVELAAIAPDAARIPASNMKLVTTAAALVLLGPSTEFRTPVEALGTLDGGVLRGDLVVHASGDPVVRADGDARVEARLDGIAQGLLARGVRRVTGDLVLDEGSFGDPAPAPGWPDASQYWQEHCALAGGFSLNGGVLQARVSSGRSGAPAEVSVHPAPHGLGRLYDVKTGQGRLDVRVGATRSAVTVKGTIPAGTPLYTPDFSHPDPVELFGSVLRDRLERAGIRIEGSVLRRRGNPRGEVLAELRSSVDETFLPINADSRNSVADQLFLSLGNALFGDGTRSGGARATAEALRRLDVSRTGFRQLDGSGLSRDNRVTARQLTALLSAVLTRDERSSALFRSSLAVAGTSGTLSDRLRGTAAEGAVRAKTGWIRGVSSLSGLCETVAGELVVFSILVEYPKEVGGLNTAVFKPMQDEILLRLVEGT